MKLIGNRFKNDFIQIYSYLCIEEYLIDKIPENYKGYLVHYTILFIFRKTI